MKNDTPAPLSEQRLLVQRIITGRIPSGKELDACREVLSSECDEKTAFAALFTLLEGALSDPFFAIEDTRQVVPIIKALARGRLEVGELL